MAEVRVIIDPLRQAQLGAAGLLEVATEADYWPARLRIRQALSAGEALVCWVTAEPLSRRFDDLDGDPRVTLERFSLRDELATALGVPDVPDIIPDTLIISSDLITLARQRPRWSAESVQQWCVRTLMGEAWTLDAPHAADVPTLLVELAQGTDTDLRGLISWRVQAWARKAAGSPEMPLWTWLAEEPCERSRCILSVACSQPYGDVSLQWLTQDGFSVELITQARALLDHLPVLGRVPASVLGSVLRRQLGASLQAALQDSGVPALGRARAGIGGELTAVLDYLRARAQSGQLLTPDEARQVIDWCADIDDPSLGAQVSCAAGLLTEAPLPAPLALDTDWETASEWLQSRYLPAYLCRAVSNRLDETVQQVEGFETWLCENYPRLMQETDAGLHCFRDGGDAIPQEATVVLVLLDGAPVALTTHMKELLARDAALCLHREKLHLACVPTLTPINKPCILSGRLPDQTPKGREEQTVAQALGVPQKPCRTITILDDLATVTPGERVFYDHLPVDQDLLHKPFSPLDRWLRAYASLRVLSNRIAQLAQVSRDAGLPLWIGCISDHGWTELPESAEVIQVPESMADDETHRRALKGTADDRYGIPLPHDRYFLACDYTVARGYNVLGRRPHGAVHGGLTPQEVAVLGFWATTALPEGFEPLDLQVEGTIRRAVAENPVALLLSNPNPATIIVTRLDLEGLAPAGGALPLDIPGRGAGSVGVNCDASRCRGAFRVHGVIYWRTEGGRPHSQPVDFSVPTTGAATTAPSFEDMLDV